MAEWARTRHWHWLFYHQARKMTHLLETLAHFSLAKANNDLYEEERGAIIRTYIASVFCSVQNCFHESMHLAQYRVQLESLES